VSMLTILGDFAKIDGSLLQRLVLIVAGTPSLFLFYRPFYPVASFLSESLPPTGLGLLIKTFPLTQTSFPSYFRTVSFPPPSFLTGSSE